MSQNRFNQYSTEGDANVTNGSLDIYGYSLRASNLNPSEPLKTNSINQLISSKLDISDVLGLQTELNATIQTPYNDGDIVITAGNIVSQDVVTDDIVSLNGFKIGVDLSIDDLQLGKVQKTGDTMTGNLTAPDIIIDNAPSLNTFVEDTETSLLSLTTGKVSKSGDTMTGNLDMNSNEIQNVNLLKVDNIQSKNLVDDIVCGSNLDMNNNDLLDIGSMTITSTQYISKLSDLPIPVGDFYVIPDNTTWIILSQLTLQYGIQYGVNCSLRGIDFSSTIEFDESARNCSIKVVDNNFYLSQISIVNGGGRFSLSGRGLLDAQNYNLTAAAPFYGRNKRFKVTDCNILRPWKIGTVEGFGTLNVTNNFFNGGGGLAAQPEAYYTNDGLSVSDGLSLEFNNNKMVLMLGAQQVSTAKLLNMKARVSPLLGFNAVTITGNIFHPRSTETGIDFDDDSRTQLGNISGNVFIRTGGSSPLINYSDQTLYDNYNPISIENYSINANAGIPNSEANLKSAILSSESTTSVNPSRTAIVPTFNDQIIKIDSSARFAIQLDCSGVTVPFVAFERIQYGNNPAFHTAYIMAVEPEAGGLQTIFVTDMSTSPLQIPNPVAGWTSPSGGACSSALYQYRWRYSEKDPRKLITVATFTISTANNEEYFVAPGNGVADASCEVSGVANASGVGGTVSLSCSRTYSEGDIVNFFLSSAGGSATSIVKGIINIK
jgi:hypothetical protein